MLRIADNVFSVVLDDNTKVALPGTLAVVTDLNLPKGSICAVDAGMRHLINAAAITTAGRYRIVQGKGAGKQLMMSPMITLANTTVSASKHTLAVQQKSIVGWSGVGTVGKLPVSASTDFFIKIRKNDNDAANRSQPMSLFAGPVKTSATPSEIGLAIALAGNGVANFKDEPANNYLEFGVICSNAGAATTSGTVTIAKGSRELTFAGIAGIVVAGAYLRINHTGVGAPAVATDSVYRITKITGNVATLDRAYTGITHAAAAAICTVAITKVLAEAVANLSGVVMTGVLAPFDVNAFRDYYVNRFSVAFSDTPTVITTTGARTGSGVWQQVAMDEYMSYGFEGQNGMLGVPPAMRDQEVITDGKYGCVEISWADTIQGLVSLQGGKGAVLFYVNLNTTTGALGAASTGAKLVTALGKAAADVQQ
tara:strand:- start:45 stop:1316 length:1272 start_codon:yes stop_codon:yes gene_type:complete